MRALKRLLIATAVILPAAVLAQTATVKTPVPATQAAPSMQVRLDETAQLKLQVARLQQQVDTMRQQMDRTSQALDQLQRKYAGHFHGVQGSAIPISQFAGEASRHYPNTRVSVDRGLLQTGGPKNN